MSDVVTNDADIEREKERRREEIREKIASLKRKIEKLEEYKDRLSEKSNDIEADVHEPASKYDLTVATDIVHWEGNLEVECEGYRDDTTNGIGVFLSGISDVIGTIEEVIERLWDEISELEDELASI